MNAVETNAALILTENKNAAWSLPSRLLGTTYTNTSGRWRFVAVSVSQAANSGLGGTSSAAVTVEFTEDGGALQNYTIRTVGILAVTTTRVNHAYFLIGPNGTYRLVNADANSGVGSSATSTISQWAETDLDNIHAAQTWAHGEVVSALTKPNNYANDVNAALDKDGDVTYESKGTATTIQTANGFSLVSIKGGSGNLSLRNSGGGDSTVGSINGAVRTVCAVVNKDGGTTMSAAPTYHYHHRWPRVSATDIAFTAAESGAATRTKWTDLDDRASQGANPSQGFTRTTGTSTGTIITPTRMCFVVVVAAMAPITLAAGTVTTTVAAVEYAAASEAAAASPINADSAMAVLADPGSAAAITVANATVEWWAWELNA